MIRAVRAARQGRAEVTSAELLRRTALRQDFGAVARVNPVQPALEVPRQESVALMVDAATAGATAGAPVVVVGPPGQGKTWACQQLIDQLTKGGWLVAEHYCYLAVSGVTVICAV